MSHTHQACFAPFREFNSLQEKYYFQSQPHIKDALDSLHNALAIYFQSTSATRGLQVPIRHLENITKLRTSVTTTAQERPTPSPQQQKNNVNQIYHHPHLLPHRHLAHPHRAQLPSPSPLNNLHHPHPPTHPLPLLPHSPHSPPRPPRHRPHLHPPHPLFLARAPPREIRRYHGVGMGAHRQPTRSVDPETGGRGAGRVGYERWKGARGACLRVWVV